ncbi:MAG: hypothetical protein K0S31_4323 [Sphingobacterium multivorum]|jgi:hypothetical protein|nr:hypothetical protein [Sphingobacterium multivorum]
MLMVYVLYNSLLTKFGFAVNGLGIRITDSSTNITDIINC